jgi:hypothetical protein
MVGSLLNYAIIVVVMMIVAVCVDPVLMLLFNDDWRLIVLVAQLDCNGRSLCHSADGYGHV